MLIETSNPTKKQKIDSDMEALDTKTLNKFSRQNAALGEFLLLLSLSASLLFETYLF
jgi:hypothetical protein